MKSVYITFSTDGENERIVDKVFKEFQFACKWIIDTSLSKNSYYKDYTNDELYEEAAKFVEKYEVE